MAEFGKHHLSDAVPHTPPEAGHGDGGKPKPTHELTAEETREAAESQKARDAEASNRDRMVHIGRGNQQAGRQGQ